MYNVAVSQSAFYIPNYLLCYVLQKMLSVLLMFPGVHNIWLQPNDTNTYGL